MADKQLRSITFPGLENRYIIPDTDTTLSESGIPADAKKVGDEITDLKDDLNDILTLNSFNILSDTHYGITKESLTDSNRIITKDINKFTVRRVANSTSYRYIRLFGGLVANGSSTATGVITYDNSIRFPEKLNLYRVNATTRPLTLYAYIKYKRHVINDTGNNNVLGISCFAVDSEDNVSRIYDSVAFGVSNHATTDDEGLIVFDLGKDLGKRFNFILTSQHTSVELDFSITLVAIPDSNHIITNVEASTTATKNYSIGDMLIVGNNLYKVTSAIATGGTITEGTNVSATTIEAELKATDATADETYALFEELAKLYPTPEAPLAMWGGSFENTVLGLTHKKHGNVYRLSGTYSDGMYRVYNVCMDNVQQIATGSNLPSANLNYFPITGLSDGEYVLKVRAVRYSYSGTTPLYIRVFELASDGTTVTQMFSNSLESLGTSGSVSKSFTASEGARYCVALYVRKGTMDVEIESSIEFAPTA